MWLLLLLLNAFLEPFICSFMRQYKSINHFNKWKILWCIWISLILYIIGNVLCFLLVFHLIFCINNFCAHKSILQRNFINFNYTQSTCMQEFPIEKHIQLYWLTPLFSQSTSFWSISICILFASLSLSLSRASSFLWHEIFRKFAHLFALIEKPLNKGSDKWFVIY